MIRAPSDEPVNRRWLLTGLVGRGSSSVVYRSFDLVSERVVAVKALLRGRPGGAPHRRARREFLDLLRLRHPNLVETFELSEAESGPLPAGTPFFTMELLEGPALGGGGDPSEPRRLARIALDLAAALECIHAHGLVHRDLKPSNVLRDEPAPGRERVKLSDLGLASRPRAGGRRFSGTLHYAAPETIATGRADPRSDLYSLGVLLFEAASGSLPFDEADPAAALAWHLGASRPVGTADGRIRPAGLARAIARLLEASPRARCPSARHAWEEFAEAAPDEAEEARVDAGGAEGPFVGRRAERERLARWLRAAQRARRQLDVEGPPGCGLSRFAREAAVLGRAGSWSVHLTRCRPGDPLFAPLFRPLRELLLDAYRNSGLRGGPTETEILTLLGGPALWEAGPGSRSRVIERPYTSAIARFLGHAARSKLSTPLLVVLDDFDRADEGTREVVRLLAADERTAGPNLVLITTHHAPVRRHEDPRGVPGSRKLEEGDRPSRRAAGELGGVTAVGGVERVEMSPLSDREAELLIESLPGVGRLTVRETAAIVAASAGLPSRLVGFARASAGRQRVLFPPVCEPRAGA